MYLMGCCCCSDSLEELRADEEEEEAAFFELLVFRFDLGEVKHEIQLGGDSSRPLLSLSLITSVLRRGLWGKAGTDL